MSKEILIIEDEPGLQISLEDNLVNEGYRVTIRSEGISGEQAALEGSWDLILLDIMLPGKDGFDVCKNLRLQGIKTPIIMLTARTLVMDRVMGLNLGADDYISKPFDIQELLARVNALLRRGEYRSGKEDDPRIAFGDFILDRERALLEKKGKMIPLGTREYLLLKYFAENPNRVIDRNELLDKVWDYESVATTRTVDVHVAWLRRKLGEQKENRHILTARGLGYRFSPDR